MHATGYSNMEALQVTKVLAHYEHTVEKHALPNANTTTRSIAQEEGVQNRHRKNTQAWGKTPENTTPKRIVSNTTKA
jgi:PhoPQ-activated pathogenicity-related protein